MHKSELNIFANYNSIYKNQVYLTYMQKQPTSIKPLITIVIEENSINLIKCIKDNKQDLI